MSEKQTIQVGDEHVEFDAVVGRNVPEHVDLQGDDDE